MDPTKADSSGNDAGKDSRPAPTLVVVGAGGHAVSVANVAISAGYVVKCFVGNEKGVRILLGFHVVRDLAELDDLDSHSYGIAVGDNAARERVYNKLVEKHGSLRFPALLHASAVVSSFASVGSGTVVMPNAVVGPNSQVGRFCLINTQASIDHDCIMRDFSSLGPRAVTGGGVHIGLRSAVAIGATIKHGLKIGDDSVLGANSYLNRDLPNNLVAYGTPARQVRSRKVGEPYL